MAPRGLKALLARAAGQADGQRQFAGARRCAPTRTTGAKLRGLTKCLEAEAVVGRRAAADGQARRSSRRRALGRGQGRQMRGKRVDAQLTRLINAGPAAWKAQHHVYRLTKMTAACTREDWSLWARSAASSPIATASAPPSTLWRTAPPTAASSSSSSSAGTTTDAKQPPNATARRHDAGRAAVARARLQPPPPPAARVVTRHLFVGEKATLARMGELGVHPEVDGLLMYANDAGVEFYELDAWWRRRGPKILASLCACSARSTRTQ